MNLARILSLSLVLLMLGVAGLASAQVCTVPEAKARRSHALATALAAGRAPLQTLAYRARRAGFSALWIRQIDAAPSTLTQALQSAGRNSDAPIRAACIDVHSGRSTRCTCLYAPVAGTLQDHGRRLDVSWRRSFSDIAVYAINDLGLTRQMSLGTERGRKGTARAALMWDSDTAPWCAVQLVGTGPHGRRPLAGLRRVAPTCLDDALLAYGRTLHLHRKPLAWLHAFRVHAAVPRLRRNNLLERVAKRRVATMCGERTLAHPTGSADGPSPMTKAALADVLAKAGIKTRASGEAIGRGASLRGALLALATSPSHRHILQAQDTTDVGFAHAEVAGEHCVLFVTARYPKLMH